MPTPALLDSVLMAALALFVPLHGAWEYRRLVRRVRAGEEDARAAEYRSTMIAEWTVATVLISGWLYAGRPVDALGLTVPGGGRLILGVAITALGVGLLYAHWRAVAGMDAAGLDALRTQMAGVVDFLPRTDREAALFRWLSITAGVCEELVYRGYVIWYLAAFFGLWPAAFLAALAFGVLHLYQGPTGVVKTGGVGLVMGVVFVATGSLLWPAVLHTAIDIQGGAVARRALTALPDQPVEAGLHT